MENSFSRFDRLHAEQQGTLGPRLLEFLKEADEPLTALQLTGLIVGVKGKYAVHVSERVQAALPEVTGVLNALVAEQKVRSAVDYDPAVGQKVLYAKLLEL